MIDSSIPKEALEFCDLVAVQDKTGMFRTVKDSLDSPEKLFEPGDMLRYLTGYRRILLLDEEEVVADV